MMTSFTRIIIVLSLLRQALGTQQLAAQSDSHRAGAFHDVPGHAADMAAVNDEALRPYMDGTIEQDAALTNAQARCAISWSRRSATPSNDDDVLLFTDLPMKPPKVGRGRA